MVETKKIYDPVHGFIRFDALEGQLIDSPPFQRLHDIHQLGIAYRVYPGAKHTRFEHSLGTMELATRIFDRLLTKVEIPNTAYYRRILRLAALCHDMGHLPFSHVAESAILGPGGHEKWTLAFIKSHYLEHIWQSPSMMVDVMKFAVGEKTLKAIHPEIVWSEWDKALSQIISGDFFGADRIDYLLRDAQCTGVSYGLLDYDQLIEMLVLVSFNGSLAMGVEENGVASSEALLLARYFMHKRVYQYPAVKAYAFHLVRFMKSRYAFHSLDEYLRMTDHEVLVDLKGAKDDPDAQAIVTKKGRFKAFPILDEVEEEDLLGFQKEFQIPDAELVFQLEKKRAKSSLFPILKANGEVVDAIHSLFLLPPETIKGWIFVSPRYAELIEKRSYVAQSV